MGDTVQKGSSEDRCAEADESSAEARSAALRGVAETENAGDARGERTAISSETESGSSAPFFHGGERARVPKVIAASGDSDVVAAVFTRDANALIQPPNRRMEKEKRLDDDLEKIDESVEAANVREFVGDDGFDLIFGESGESADGKQNDGFEPADDGGCVEPFAFAEANGAIDAEASLQFAAL